MNNVIVITSGKGGVGKTTTTANIGAGLALQGKKVVLIDTDIGLRNLDVVLGLENRIVFDLVDVTDGTCRLKQALIRDKRFENLFLLPAAQTKDKLAVKPEQMKTLIAEMESDYDYILIDCPAGIEQGFLNAVAGAKSAIVVTVPEVSSVRDADRIVGLLSANGIDDVKLLINRYRADLVKKGDMLSVDDLVDILGLEIVGIVPEDEMIFRSTNLGEPLVAGTGSLAGQAYKNIVRRILGEDVELLALKSGGKLSQGLKKLFKIK